MAKTSDERIQLNLWVTHGVNDMYREHARAAGYGNRPSPFLALILQLQACFLQAVLKRLTQKNQTDPDFFQSREQRFYAREILLLMGDILEVPEKPTRPVEAP